MISRVRGRIRSDSFSKIQTMKSEDKIANIGEYPFFFKYYLFIWVVPFKLNSDLLQNN